MKKAVITILGIQGAGYTDEGEAYVKDYKHQALYYFENQSNAPKAYYNTLPLLIKTYAKEYQVIPIYTQEAKTFNQEVLSYENIECTFDDTLGLIQDEKDYFKIFSQIDKTINQFDSVIIDLTHGFRHLPILTIIDIVIQNFKSKTHIEKILFAKEIIKHTPQEVGEYEIVDLNKYLEIANLSFVIANFKDNYTISSNINTKQEEYKELIDAMRTFSRDILGLSMQHFYSSSLPRLYQAIDAISDSSILKNDLEIVKKHLEVFNFQNLKRYEIYFNTAKELLKKEYLLQSINLLHEAKQFYLKSAIKSQNKETHRIITDVEQKIETYNNNNKFNNYKLLQDCLSIFFQKEPKNLSLFNDQEAKILKQYTLFNYQFKNFLQDDLRNNLAHANNSDNIDNVKKEIDKNIQNFEKLCIDNNVLNLKKAI